MRLLLEEKGDCWVAIIFILSISQIWLAGWAETTTIAWPQAKGKISGQVLGRDAKPLIGASVRLLVRGGEANGISARTDDEGVFRFSAVAPGDYSLMAQKGGYVRQVFGGTDPFNLSAGTPIHVGEGREIKNIAIRLQQGGVIRGKITFDNGEPVVAATVQALFKRDQFVFSTAMILPSPFLTDDRGVYRIYGLPSGQYLVSVNPQNHSVGLTKYPVTYYPSVRSKDEATEIELAAGSGITGINIEIYRGRKLLGISGQVTRRSDGSPMSGAFIGAAKDREHGSPLRAPADEDGRYSFENLASGSYTVFVLTQEPELAQRTQRKMEVISEPVEPNILIGEAAEISGRFELQGNRHPESVQGLTVFAISADDPMLQFHASPEADGAFTLARLPSGDFNVVINANQSKHYTKAIIYGDEDITDEVLQIGGGDKYSGL